MTKVTINPTPAQEIIAKANTEVSVPDARGRILVLKKPRFSAQWDLSEMLGPELAENSAYLSQCIPLLYLQSLDGKVENFNTVREMKALLDRLEGEGWVALMAGIKNNFGTQGDGADSLKK